jgi:hypothetical protein
MLGCGVTLRKPQMAGKILVPLRKDRIIMMRLTISRQQVCEKIWNKIRIALSITSCRHPIG